MKLVIEIDVDNDDVQDAAGLSLVLDEVTRSVVQANDCPRTVLSRRIRDGNGNTIGLWKVMEGRVEEMT